MPRLSPHGFYFTNVAQNPVSIQQHVRMFVHIVKLQSSVVFPRKNVTGVKILNAELSTSLCLCVDLFHLHRYVTLPRISFQRLRTSIGLELPESEQGKGEFCLTIAVSVRWQVNEILLQADWWNDASKETSILQKSLTVSFCAPQIQFGLAWIEPMLLSSETGDQPLVLAGTLGYTCQRTHKLLSFPRAFNRSGIDCTYRIHQKSTINTSQR